MLDSLITTLTDAPNPRNPKYKRIIVNKDIKTLKAMIDVGKKTGTGITAAALGRKCAILAR